MFKKLEPIFDIMGEILAVLLVVVWVLSLTNAQWGYLNGSPAFVDAITILRNYGGILLIGVVGMEAMCKRNLVLFIVFCAMLAFIIIFLFFPATYDNLIILLSRKK